MKAQGILTVLFGLALAASGQQSPPSDFETSRSTETPRRNYLQWDDPKWWETMRGKTDAIPLGKSDVTVSGPIVETLRWRPRKLSDLSLAEKIASLPIINLVIPQPFHPAPRKSGRYFAWGESDTPWINRVEGDIARPPALISFGF
jgi:hypothetical protein